MKKTKRALTFLLVLALLCSQLSLAVFATDPGVGLDSTDYYHVTYNSNAGSDVTDDHYWHARGTSVTVKGPPTRSGYVFQGWDLLGDGSNHLYQPGDTFNIYSNVTFKAEWVQSKTFTLQYDLQGGSANPALPGSTQYSSGDTVNIPSTVPTKTGLKFMGWDLKGDGTSAPLFQPGGSFTINNSWDTSLELEAVWKYGVTYDGDGGTPVPTDSNGYNSNDWVQVKSGTPSKLGYTFTGWDRTDTGTVEDLDSGDWFRMPSNSVTLKAMYVLTNYDVDYLANGGSGVPSDSTDYHMGDTVTVKGPAPTRSGYRFMGYDIKNSGSPENLMPGDTFTMPAKDVDLEAQWSRLYGVDYHLNGGSGPAIDDPNKYIAGETVTLVTDVPTPPEGHTFAGWSFDSHAYSSVISGTTFTMPSHDVNLYAQFTRGDFSLTVYHVYGSNAPVLDEEQSDGLRYGDDVHITKVDKPGYTYANRIETGVFELNVISGWKISDFLTINGNNGTVTGEVPDYNATITFYYDANTDTPYAIEHYFEDLNGGYPAVPDETDNLTGTTDDAISAAGYIRSYPEYTVDTASSTLTGTIGGDGETVLKVFYALGDDMPVPPDTGLTINRFYYVNGTLNNNTSSGFDLGGYPDRIVPIMDIVNAVDFGIFHPDDTVTIEKTYLQARQVAVEQSEPAGDEESDDTLAAFVLNDEELGEEPAEEPSEEVGEEPAEEPAEEVGEEPAEEPAEEVGEEPAEELAPLEEIPELEMPALEIQSGSEASLDVAGPELMVVYELVTETTTHSVDESYTFEEGATYKVTVNYRRSNVYVNGGDSDEDDGDEFVLTIAEETVPLATIEEVETPKAELPKTGSDAMAVAGSLGSLSMLTGALAAFWRKRK